MTGRLPDVWTGNAAFSGSGGALVWDHVAIVFADAATLDLDHTTATFAAAGYTWNQGKSSTGTIINDLDLVNGTGLVADMGVTSSTIDYRATGTGAGWWAGLPLVNLWADFSAFDSLVVRAMLGGIGDADQESHGIGLGNGKDAASQRHVGVHVGTYGVDRGANRASSGSILSDANATDGSFDCVQIVATGPVMRVYAGIVSAGEYPVSWTEVGTPSGGQVCPDMPGNSSNDRQWISATMEIVLQAATGNASDNFAPAWKRVDCYRLKDSGVVPP